MVVRSGLTPTSRRGRRASPGNRPRSGSRPWWSVRQRFLTSTKSPIEAPISCPRLGREVRAAAGTASQPSRRHRARGDCIRAYFGRGTSRWALEGGEVHPPRQWKARKTRNCLGCGQSMTDAHWRRDRHRAVANRAASKRSAGSCVYHRARESSWHREFFALLQDLPPEQRTDSRRPDSGFSALLTAGHAQRADDGVRPRQPSPERARVKAPADLRNCTGKTQGHLCRMK